MICVIIVTVSGNSCRSEFVSGILYYICIFYHVLQLRWHNRWNPSLGKTTTCLSRIVNWPLAIYVTLRVAHAQGMPGTFPCHQLQRKPLVSDPGMHHGTCVTHVPWCVSGSLNCGGEENVPTIPGVCATHNFTYLARGPYHDNWWRGEARS